MLKFPMSFTSEATATPGAKATWSATSHGNQPITCAIPPEFMGPGGGYSPEDLYGLALANCVLATFKVFAEKSGVTFTEAKATAETIIDKGQDGKPWINKINLTITLTGASDPAKAETVLKESKAACIVCSSMKTEVALTTQVS